MLTILLDPAGITGRKRHDWNLSATLQANIAQHLASGADCELTLNGVRVDPLTDPRMDRPPSVLDMAVIVRRPRGFDPLSWTAIAIYAAIGAVALTYALMPRAGGAGNVGKDSPNNSLTAQSNVARAYQAIPDVYGYRRCWPDLIQPSTVEYVDHIKYVTEWLCISRGKGTISAIQYAETPIADISGASYEIFEPVPVDGYPEYGDTTLSDVLETFASDEVNGQEIAAPTMFSVVTAVGSFSATSGSAVFTVSVPDKLDLLSIKSLAPSGEAQVSFTYADPPVEFLADCTVTSFSVVGGLCTFTFTAPSAWASTVTGSLISFRFQNLTTGPTSTIGPFTLPVQCDRLRFNTVFLRGLKGSVVIRASWWQIDGGGVTIGGTLQTADYTFTADTLDQRFYTTDVTPTAGFGRYRVQFTRITPEQGDGADVAKLEELFAVRHHATKVLPGVTVIRVTTKATTDATGFSDRKFNLRWLRYVRQLDSDTLSASRNFGRAMAHIWTIAGNPISGLDTAKLAEINAEFGETAPRLRFDGSLDDADASLGERLQLVANMARCVVWRDGLRWTVTRDQARPYPELQLDYRNLAAGGESSISYASHLPATNDGVEIEYVDEESQSKKAYIRLSITSGTPVEGAVRNPKKIKLPGCTTYSQAMDRAQLEARRLLYQRVSVSDTALSDGSALGLGSLVRWIDPNDFAGDDGLQAGEVLGIAGNVILTSEELDWKGQASGRILFTGADGRHLGPPVVCTPSGTSVQLASVPAGLYVADATRQLGSRYAFGVGLTEAEMQAAGLYTATELKPGADGTVSIALAAYDDRIYEGDE